jgi:hypothetical protein
MGEVCGARWGGAAEVGDVLREGWGFGLVKRRVNMGAVWVCDWEWSGVVGKPFLVLIVVRLAGMRNGASSV